MTWNFTQHWCCSWLMCLSTLFYVGHTTTWLRLHLHVFKGRFCCLGAWWLLCRLWFCKYRTIAIWCFWMIVSWIGRTSSIRHDSLWSRLKRWIGIFIGLLYPRYTIWQVFIWVWYFSFWNLWWWLEYLFRRGNLLRWISRRELFFRHCYHR